MSKRPFYAQGLRFSCTRCSSCCRFDPGFVFLTQTDLDALTAELGMAEEGFIAVYCRWVPPPGAGVFSQLSLKEKSNYDCIFWKDGCTVYNARPVQCRTFPFWASILESKDSWENTACSCPGIGKGKLLDGEYIRASLKERHSEAIVMKGTNI
jgi:Fe-S-cluster containining protein